MCGSWGGGGEPKENRKQMKLEVRAGWGLLLTVKREGEQFKCERERECGMQRGEGGHTNNKNPNRTHKPQKTRTKTRFL